MPLPFSVTRDFTAPYSAVEAWNYDRFIAPAVMQFAALAVDPMMQGAARDASVLDVGCGGGHLLSHIAKKRADLHLHGVDLNARQVGRARKRTSSFEDRVSVVEGSALDLPYEDATFDFVVSVASIKHWPDKMTGLKEVARVLKTGGKMYVAEVDRGCSLEDAKRFVNAWPIPHPVRALALPLFRTYVAGQGLEIDEARHYLNELPLKDASIDRPEGMPVLVLQGTRA